MTRFNSTERLGVTEVERIFLLLGWIPRTIFQTDVGVDMTVEICQNGNPVGKFIGVQIKTGESWFNEKINNSIIFRSDKTHIDYWLNNSLPIIIVLHSLKENLTIWQKIDRETVASTGKNFKIEVPLTNKLGEESKNAIEILADGSPLLNKIQRLIIDKPIIDKLKAGNKIVVELERWVNKSSGRADIKIYQVINDEDPDEQIELVQILLEEYSAIGVNGYQSLYYFYPWADFKTDETFYANYSDYDEEYTPGYRLVFDDDRFHDYKLPIVPYDNNGETSTYRLIMELNEFGNVFLDFYEYIEGKKQLELKFD